jgi:hypothetical protein
MPGMNDNAPAFNEILDYFIEDNEQPYGPETQFSQAVCVGRAPARDRVRRNHENMLVFASDRPGGFGGYDLYLSRYTRDEVWSEPANLQALMPDGVLLNTPANEFRPSLLVFPRGAYHGDSHRVLLFSSDRAGGRGGYDLYLTALP